MKRIDFIGPSGAGKTTLFKQLLLERNITKEWVTPQEARIEIAMQQKNKLIKSNLVSFISYCIYFLFKRKISFLKLTLEKLLRDEYTHVFKNKYTDYNCLFELLLDSWCIKIRSLKPYNRMHFCHFYEKILIRDVALLDYFNYEGVVIYEDGILHNNIGIANADAYEKILNLSSEERKKIIPNGIIYCNLPLEENILRRKKRIESGKMTLHEQNISEDELIQLSKEAHENAAIKVNLMRDLNVPVLEIDMTKTTEENIPLVSSFIGKIANQVSADQI